uniref:zinc finger protein 513a n=1 Tax=Pristiophorus japonicus TaxID=55135 RepID=UPI00398F104E
MYFILFADSDVSEFLKNADEPGSLLDTGDGEEESDSLPELLLPFTCQQCGMVLDDCAQENSLVGQLCPRCIFDGLTHALGEEGEEEDIGGGEISPGKADKVFPCKLCTFVSQYPNHLVRHMKTHSGEKPYKCSHCDYASAHLDNLKRHVRIHTGEKPFKCDRCSYACGNMANLKRHERIHSGDKPFKCHICNYSCNQSMNLKRHMLRHTGEKPFKCPQCEYTTGHWDNYKRHQKTHGWMDESQKDCQEQGQETELTGGAL